MSGAVPLLPYMPSWRIEGRLYLLAAPLKELFHNRPAICHCNIARSVEQVSVTRTKAAGLDAPQYSPATAVTVRFGASPPAAQHKYSRQLGPVPAGLRVGKYAYSPSQDISTALKRSSVV
jgi:hypothetical protein